MNLPVLKGFAMRIHRLKKLVLVIGIGGFLWGQVNCLPSRNQINATINGGILSGVQLALTLGITNFLAPGLLDSSGGQDTTQD